MKNEKKETAPSSQLPKTAAKQVAASGVRRYALRGVKRGSLRYQLALLTSSSLWGASFIFTKDLFNNVPHITALFIITGRMLVASLCFVPYMLLTHRLPRLRGKEIGLFMLLAFFEPFLYSLCETNGVALVSGSLSAIIIALIPLLMPFAMATFMHERLHGREVAGIAISLFGIMLTIIGPGFTLTASPRGLLLLCGAVVIAVVYTMILSRVLHRYHPFVVTCYQNLFAFFYFLPLLLLHDHETLQLIAITPRMVLSIVFLGLFCSTLAYVCYNYGMRAVGATRSCAYSNLIPVFSLILALLIGQEHLSLMKVVGMIVVVAGLYVAQRNSA